MAEAGVGVAEDDDDGACSVCSVENDDGGLPTPRCRGKRTQISAREYYAHRLQIRERHANGTTEIDDALHRAGRLFQVERQHIALP